MSWVNFNHRRSNHVKPVRSTGDSKDLVKSIQSFYTEYHDVLKKEDMEKLLEIAQFILNAKQYISQNQVSELKHELSIVKSKYQFSR